jgi:hypothetical protein
MDDYNRLLSEVKFAKLKNKKSKAHFNTIKRFDVLTVGDNHKLIAPLNANKLIVYYVSIEQMYDILENTHKAIQPFSVRREVDVLLRA